MPISVFDLFSIGIGPSSSHTVGPMRAALQFVKQVATSKILNDISEITIDLYGSLALTGIGHGTDQAILLGLSGETPEHVDPSSVKKIVEEIRRAKTLKLLGKTEIPFVESLHLLFHKEKQLPLHPNGMRFTVSSSEGNELLSQVYYSVGGGFILKHEEMNQERHLANSFGFYISSNPSINHNSEC